MSRLVEQLDTSIDSVSFLEIIDELEKEVHRMIGTAGSLGFQKLTEISKELQTELKVVVEVNTAPANSIYLAKIQKTFESLRSCSDQSISEFLKLKV